jgi:hypothetical protein
VQDVQQGEAGNLGLAGGQSDLHQTLRLLRGTALSDMTIKDVAEETRLDCKTIKALDEQYMQEQLVERARLLRR